MTLSLPRHFEIVKNEQHKSLPVKQKYLQKISMRGVYIQVFFFLFGGRGLLEIEMKSIKLDFGGDVCILSKPNR